MKTFKRILLIAKPYWPIGIGAFISSVLFAMFNAASLWVVGTLIGTIMGMEQSVISGDSGLVVARATFEVGFEVDGKEVSYGEINSGFHSVVIVGWGLQAVDKVPEGVENEF